MYKPYYFWAILSKHYSTMSEPPCKNTALFSLNHPVKILLESTDLFIFTPMKQTEVIEVLIQGDL